VKKKSIINGKAPKVNIFDIIGFDNVSCGRIDAVIK